MMRFWRMVGVEQFVELLEANRCRTARLDEATVVVLRRRKLLETPRHPYRGRRAVLEDVHRAVRQGVLDVDLKVTRKDPGAFGGIRHQPFGDAEMQERTADELGDPFRIRRRRRNDQRVGSWCRTLPCGA